jgi:hypothetical protein
MAAAKTFLYAFSALVIGYNKLGHLSSNITKLAFSLPVLYCSSLKYQALKSQALKSQALKSQALKSQALKCPALKCHAFKCPVSSS